MYIIVFLVPFQLILDKSKLVRHNSYMRKVGVFKEVDMVTDMGVDMLADMEADLKVDMVAEMVG